MKVLQQPNLDYPKTALEELLSRLFPEDMESRLIDYDEFLRVMLKQDLPGLKKLCILE